MKRINLSLCVFLSCCSLPTPMSLAMQENQIPEQEAAPQATTGGTLLHQEGISDTDSELSSQDSENGQVELNDQVKLNGQVELNDQRELKEKLTKIAELIYSGNAENGDVHTYIILCRDGADGSNPRLEALERDCCTCDACKFCSGGLSIAFITTEGKLSGMD